MIIKTPLKLVALLATLSVSACIAPDATTPTPATATDETPVTAPTQTTVASNPVVDPAFKRGGGTWDPIGSAMFRYTAIERNGEIYICGAFTARGSGTIRRLSREVMRQATVTANGQTVLRNLRFFREASNAAYPTQLVGVETNCASTGDPVGSFPLNSVVVETRPGRYRI